MSFIKKLFQERQIRLDSFSWLAALTKPYLGKISGLILLRCVVAAVGVGSAVVNKYIVDMASQSMNLMWGIVLAVCCTLCSLIGNTCLNIYTTRVTEKFSFHIRSSLYEQILNGVWSKRNQYHSEELMARLTSDVQTISGGILSVITAVPALSLQLGMAFVLLWYYEPMLALFALITGPFVVIISFIMGRKMKQVQVTLQQTEADYRVFLQEQISNADIIKMFQYEKHSQKKLEVLQQERMKWIIRKNRLSVGMRVGISLVFSGSYLVAFVSGAVKIAAGVISYGTMTAFLSLVNQVQTPIYSMYHMLSQMISVLASSSRTMEIYDIPSEVCEERAVSIETPVGIRIENVSFAYETEKPVLNKLSANIVPGNRVLLSGPSGQGKTTLVRLLSGFLEPDEGEIFFYDQKGTQIPCSSASRDYISYVPQGYTLFSGTIAENLLVGNPDADREEMCAALKYACAWEFVEKLPQGMDTVIGERALGISGGQAQRIALARAFLRKTPVLILDEATSSLDAVTEQQIMKNLCSRNSNQTCIIISHNQSVRKYVDQVIEIID